MCKREGRARLKVMVHGSKMKRGKDVQQAGVQRWGIIIAAKLLGDDGRRAVVATTC